MKKKRRKQIVLDGNVLCQYGCSGQAHYRFVFNGKVCCESHPNYCSGFKKRIGKLVGERNRGNKYSLGRVHSLEARQKMSKARRKGRRKSLCLLCACGCGRTVKAPGSKYAWGHWLRSKEGKDHHRKTTLSMIKKIELMNEEEREQMRRKRSEAQKKSYRDNPERSKQHSKVLKGKKPWNTGFTKETHSGLVKLSESQKGHLPWNKGLTKEEHSSIASTSKKLKGRKIWCEGFTKDTHLSLESSAKKTKLRWLDPEYRKFWISRHSTKGKTKKTSEIVAKHAEMMKGRTLTDEQIKKQLSSVNAKPNKLEKGFGEFLDMLFPSQYKYVGNGVVVLGGAKPDFINTNGQKKVIEVFGDYWHSKERTGLLEDVHESQRIDHFKEYGFDCLVIWENEFRKGNQDNLISKLTSFHERRIDHGLHS